MDLKMIQDILEKVKSRTLVVEDTSSDDCNLLEPTVDDENGYIICKSYKDDTAENYEWKLTELDEWGMLKVETEAYYEKGREEYNVLEQIHTEIYK
jgi:hypothetical protein